MEEKEQNTGVYIKIVQGLGAVPAYVLVFGVAFVICTLGLIYLNDDLPIVLLLLGTLVLAGFAIRSVETRTAISVSSPEEHRIVSTMRNERDAIKGVFEGLVSNDSLTYFVYSNTPVKEFFDHKGQKIDYPFADHEKRVTTIQDARGISKVNALLHLGGKIERLKVITAQDFTDGNWENNLILIGSRNSNPKTEEALRNFNSPFRFSDDMQRIVESDSNEGAWPTSEDQEQDYGIVVKLKVAVDNREHRVYFVIAGVGPIGTLACCHYLQYSIVALHNKFKTSPFACLLSVNREVGYTSVRKEKSMEIAVHHIS